MDNLEEAHKLWEKFGEIPINGNDEIEEEFEGFQIGTDRFEIWGWFEAKFDGFIIGDLLN